MLNPSIDLSAASSYNGRFPTSMEPADAAGTRKPPRTPKASQEPPRQRASRRASVRKTGNDTTHPPSTLPSFQLPTAPAPTADALGYYAPNPVPLGPPSWIAPAAPPLPSHPTPAIGYPTLEVCTDLNLRFHVQGAALEKSLVVPWDSPAAWW